MPKLPDPFLRDYLTHEIPSSVTSSAPHHSVVNDPENDSKNISST
jgi:hypothetical protein